MMKLLSFALFLLLPLNVPASPSEEERLALLFDDIWNQTMISNPTYATYVGYPGQNALWPNPSVTAQAKSAGQRKEFLRQLRSIDAEELKPEPRKTSLVK